MQVRRTNRKNAGLRERACEIAETIFCKQIKRLLVVRSLLFYRYVRICHRTYRWKLQNDGYKFILTSLQQRERPGFSAWNFIIDTCHVARYNINMIRSFAHKGLKEFFENGSKKGIQPEHAPKLGRMLDRLDASISPQDMNLPGYRLHPLKGDKQDMWSVTVNGNWRLTFYFEGQDAHLVDYQDYH